MFYIFCQEFFQENKVNFLFSHFPLMGYLACHFIQIFEEVDLIDFPLYIYNYIIGCLVCQAFFKTFLKVFLCWLLNLFPFDTLIISNFIKKIK